jgi:hypothetical protein
VRVRKPGWYAIPEHRAIPAQVFISKAFADRHMHKFSREPMIADQRLYFLCALEGMENSLLAASMNCSLTSLATEVVGRVSLSDGALEFSAEDARDYLLVPALRNATAKKKKAITDAFEKLCEREIGSVFEEVKQADRQALDRAVLPGIGLDPKQYLQPIYDALCELVRERIELAQQRGKARKIKARKNIAERAIFTQVLDEAFPEGSRRFPDDFFSAAAAADEKTPVALPSGELTLNTDPFAMGVYTRTGAASVTLKPRRKVSF